MQTPAELALVRHLVALLPPEGETPALGLAVGAGRSLSIEGQLTAAGRAFRCDRVDVEDCDVKDPRVGRTWVASAERMDDVPSREYDFAFANYVLEHVPNVAKAAAEIARVLKPGATFVASVPNPRALEFRVADLTPTAFHEWVRGKEAWPTVYDYASIERLVTIFAGAGLPAAEVRTWPFVEGYLHRFPGFRQLARGWDRWASGRPADRLHGNVFVAFEKDEDAA